MRIGTERSTKVPVGWRGKVGQKTRGLGTSSGGWEDDVDSTKHDMR